MKKYTLMFFKKDCMGCCACEVACKQEHGLAVGPRLVRVIDNSAAFTPIFCHHCAKAPCMEICPAKAISRDGRGIVLIDEVLCIGCKECIEACPFGAMQFDDDNGTAIKCDMCVDRLADNLQPACVGVCPARCVFWGDTRELSRRVTPVR